MTFTRRNLLWMTTAGAAALGARGAFPALSPEAASPATPSTESGEKQLYASLLHTWCDGLLARQITGLADPAFHGGLLCESCALIHGRCGDAVYPLLRAAKFLDGFITIETGNVNYPVTASLAFFLCGQVLGDAHYVDRGRNLVHQVMQQFTPSGFLFGEGHPLRGVSPKGCRPVDLGYNVEESLPSLALYATLANDQAVLEQVIAAFKTHIEFMLPDGAWDNSWGTRNYKWSWWGSRTSDGCHPGLVLLSGHDPRFREAARRNLELMSACTHSGLLYGGPDYFAHGDPACIHHTFTHAKALAAVLDRGSFTAKSSARPALPRDEPYGLKSFRDIGTHLAAVGPWRATVTEYDWEYVEHVQAGGGAGGGHVSGGALSVLFHQVLGPVLTASMTEYQMIEISNQQAYRGGPHMGLTPRIECAAGETYTSLNDLKAVLTTQQQGKEIVFHAQGRLLTASRKAPEGGDIAYRVAYTLNETSVELTASASGPAPGPVSGPNPGPLRFIVPVLARAAERVERLDPRTVRIAKPKGVLAVHTDAEAGFATIPAERTFNLVPGFEAVPLEIALEPGREVHVRLEKA